MGDKKFGKMEKNIFPCFSRKYPEKTSTEKPKSYLKQRSLVECPWKV